MEEKDLYGILGVSRDASPDDLRKAYRRLARENHPDVNPNDPKAEARFKEVAFAHEVLSDPDKRKLYDEFGVKGIEQGFDPEQARTYRRWSEGAHRSPFHETFFADLDLEDLLSGAFGGGRARAARPRHVEGEITIDFLDAVRGGEVRVEIAGRGALRVRIPSGADEGTRIRLAGQGEPTPAGGAPGDLYLTLHVRPHRFYSRRGPDLYLDLPVTVPELVLGASVNVPTPHGAVQMKVPPGSPNGARLRLKGKGAARSGTSGHGDLYVTLLAQLPDGNDSELESLARKLEPLYRGRDVRAHLVDDL